ncbi:PREDICTED: LIM domain-containing protein 1 [Dipodomys ordii]|uniref:LIM domain-containing protein 1 n=1 Tax=Dipodomys ordii TaxID=10020 RepID=A0A1S3GA09_DIPOR|nr:PREDICTED: LIM domain-containing protein 1 [Dipodomys ordii]
MDKYEDLGLEASKFIEYLNMYEASRDGLFRVDKGPSNNPEFEETRRVFATKMAKIHLQQQQQQQQQLLDSTLPRASSRASSHSGDPLATTPSHRDPSVAGRGVTDGASKPPLAAPTLGVTPTAASGQPSYPGQEQRARPCVQTTRPGSQERDPHQGPPNAEPGPCQDPSCLTHGDYYDNLSSTSPPWDHQPGVTPSLGSGKGSGWSDPPLPRPTGEHRQHQPPPSLMSPSRSFQSGLGGQDGAGRHSEKPAGLWATASSQRMHPTLSQPGLENGAPAQQSRSAPASVSPSQGDLLRTNPGPGCEVSGPASKSTTAAPQPWLRDRPLSYLSSSAPFTLPAGPENSQPDGVPGLGPKPQCPDLGTAPKLSSTNPIGPVMSTQPDLSQPESPSNWSPEGPGGSVLSESSSPSRVRLPCQTLVSSSELGPSAVELKLEALAQRLEREMDAYPKADYFGACVKCSKGVFGAGQACQAMGNLYHDACFTCAACSLSLYIKAGWGRPGDPEARGNPMRALGVQIKTRCIICLFLSSSRVLAPKCAACGLPILPPEGSDETVRVVSMDRDYHVECYHCEDCGLELNDEDGHRCYPLEDHLFCHSCHVQRLDTSPASAPLHQHHF